MVSIACGHGVDRTIKCEKCVENWGDIVRRTPVQEIDSDKTLIIGICEDGKPYFSIGNQKFKLDYDPAILDQESARWWTDQLRIAFERLAGNT